MKNNNESWAELEKLCENCTKCQLYKTKTNTVFGKGSKSAVILFVGEAPGEQEDLQGIPFCGASGQLLDKYFAAIDMKPEEYYVGNILKCRPPHNRDPLPEEQEACIGYLREQLKLINPKIIVCLGRISAQRLISKDFKVTQQHGQFIEKGGILFMGTFHPAALLRNPNQKPDALEDFLALQRKIKEICDHTY